MDPVSVPVDNELSVTFGALKLVMKAKLGPVKELQKKIGGLIAVAKRFSESNITIEELAAIIQCGASSVEGQKVPTIQALEELIFNHGMLNVITPCANFITSVFFKGAVGNVNPPAEQPAGEA